MGTKRRVTEGATYAPRQQRPQGVTCSHAPSQTAGAGFFDVFRRSCRFSGFDVGAADPGTLRLYSRATGVRRARDALGPEQSD